MPGLAPPLVKKIEIKNMEGITVANLGVIDPQRSQQVVRERIEQQKVRHQK